jgi:hypothetical protein
LARYHGNDDPNSPLVQLEWKEFEESIKLNASDKRWYFFSPISESMDLFRACAQVGLQGALQHPQCEIPNFPDDAYGFLWAVVRERPWVGFVETILATLLIISFQILLDNFVRRE